MEDENLIQEAPVYHDDSVKNETYGYIDKLSNGEAKLGLPKSAKAKLGE